VSKHPTATREDHDDFCTTEGWTLVRGATGKPVAHHRTYELTLIDGRILRTRISRPVDRTQYRESMWSHILRTQLQVTADEFWECVTDKVLPQRSRPTNPPRKSLPLYLVEGLTRHGISLQEISAMTEEEATERLHQMWSEQG
jgi:hypothetical protein